MVTQVRYQFFVSSTYEDLREERQQTTQAILEAGHFPSGMELFPASNDTQWELIKRVIQESDYYIVLLAGRYGSLGPDGLSYTEMEYDYAVKIDVPVLGFVRENIDELPFNKSEKDEIQRTRLGKFRKKVLSKTCRKYRDSSDLGLHVLKSIISEARVHPRTGWVRADRARSDEDVERERQLEEELREARTQVERLERSIRDRDILGDEIPKAALAQGGDEFEFSIVYHNKQKELVAESVIFSWDEIFFLIGPQLFGYIVRPYYNAAEKTHSYPFVATITNNIRAKIVEKVQNRRIILQSQQIEQVIFQLKELGLVMYAEDEGDKEVFRGITLTKLGERKLTKLSVKLKQ